jgi:hypothetical protein
MSSSIDPAELRKRAAYALMCFRFGRDCKNEPFEPDKPVSVDLGSDLARSIERKVLTSAALILLEKYPGLPLIWRQTPYLDLFKELTYRKYYALCWLQFDIRTLGEEMRIAVRDTDIPGDTSRHTNTWSSTENLRIPDRALEFLLKVSGAHEDELARGRKPLPEGE